MLDTPPTPPTTLSRARAIAHQNGLHHVYTGNVHDSVGSSTCCSSCGALLIGRDGYELSAWNLEQLDSQAACARCRNVVPGVFEARPGSWGARRKPVHIMPALVDGSRRSTSTGRGPADS